MATGTKLRCFVAMAFGHEDTDNLYENSIKPVIQNVGFHPIRVDKLVHNDRIDEKIRTEIQKADVVIADLTYARPSVYWEAGYAERSVPVIYTCRQDHFVPNPEDIHGNFRVHFDLVNANILTWTEPNSSKFMLELQERLLFVTSNARKNKESQTALAMQREAFSLLSLAERQSIVLANTLEILTDAKFELLDIHASAPDQRGRARGIQSITLWKCISGNIAIVSLHPCYATIPKVRLKGIEHFHLTSFFSLNHFFVEREDFLTKFSNVVKGKISAIRRIQIVPVISAITDKRIQEVFSTWRPAGFPGWYYLLDIRGGSGEGKRKYFPSSSEIAFVRNIRSESDYVNTFSEMIRAMDAAKNTIIKP
jgi:nucleoside 2-deoxyribosyltransferase